MGCEEEEIYWKGTQGGSLGKWNYSVSHWDAGYMAIYICQKLLTYSHKMNELHPNKIDLLRERKTEIIDSPD